MPGRHWLRLTRIGRHGHRALVHGWPHLASVGLPATRACRTTVEAGLFVSSPPRASSSRRAGQHVGGRIDNDGRATFDTVSIGGVPLALRAAAVSQGTAPPGEPGARRTTPRDDRGRRRVRGHRIGQDRAEPAGRRHRAGQPVRGPRRLSSSWSPSARLFMTSEFKHGMLRTTFTASPRRGRMLAAKAVVLGVVGFGIGWPPACWPSSSRSRCCVTAAGRRRPSRRPP